jgi:hypothetical protein
LADLIQLIESTSFVKSVVMNREKLVPDLPATPWCDTPSLLRSSKCWRQWNTAKCTNSTCSETSSATDWP